jgi:hypothetical protein
MAVYQSQYRPRFFWCKENLVTYHAALTFLPRENLTEVELKATLAFFNSSFSHLYVEAEGRATALGLIALEIAQAERMPVPDIKKLSEQERQRLANAFDALEMETRKLGGADRKANLEKLEPQFEQIDTIVAEILKLPSDVAERARKLASQMMDRRLTRTKTALPEMVRGEEETLEMEPPSRKVRRARKEDDSFTTNLDQWTMLGKDRSETDG